MIQYLKPMKYLSLTIPGYGQIDAPAGIPTGGFTDSATGNSIIGWGLQVAFVIAVILVLFLIIYGGIQWMTSGGDKEKISAARNRIIYAIIGLVIIFLSVFLINIVLYLFGAPRFVGPNASGGTDNSRLIQECINSGGTPQIDWTNNYIGCN